MRALGKWIAGAVILAGVAVLVAHSAELRNFLALVQKARPSLLLVALALQLSTYFAVAKLWQTVLSRAGNSRPLRKLFSLSFAKLFADQAVPSAGLSGNVLLVQGLVRLGVSRAHATTVMAMTIIGYYAAYLVMAVIVLATLWLDQKATIILATSVTVFILVAVGILIAVFLLVSREAKVPAILKRFRWALRAGDLLAHVPKKLIRNRALLLRVTCLSASVFLADAATLWIALSAIGYPVPFPTALVAFILASIAVTLGPIPMGLGSFEAVCIATLHSLGVPVEAALAGTLVLRGLTLWLPLLPGLALARRMVARRTATSTVSNIP